MAQLGASQLEVKIKSPVMPGCSSCGALWGIQSWENISVAPVQAVGFDGLAFAFLTLHGFWLDEDWSGLFKSRVKKSQSTGYSNGYQWIADAHFCEFSGCLRAHSPYTSP